MLISQVMLTLYDDDDDDVDELGTAAGVITTV